MLIYSVIKVISILCRWGCSHAQLAKDCYFTMASQSHQSLSITEAGLFVDYRDPYLDAFPDGLVKCKCCGKGVLEVKCPFCHKENLPEDDETSFCMMKSDGMWSLKRSRAYYYQVQLQLHVCPDALYVTLFWKTDHVVTLSISRNTDFKYCIAQNVGGGKHWRIW